MVRFQTWVMTWWFVSGVRVASAQAPMPPWAVGEREAAVARLVARGEVSVPLLLRVLQEAPSADAGVALRGLVLIGAAGKAHRPAVLELQASLRPRLAELPASSSKSTFDARVVPARPRLTPQELFFACCAVLEAMDLPAGFGMKAQLEMLGDAEWTRVYVAAAHLAANGTDAAAGLPKLLELRQNVRRAVRAVGPLRAKRQVVDGEEITIMANTRREVPMEVGSDKFALPDTGLLDDVVDHAVVAVAPRHPETIAVQIVRLRDSSPEVRVLAAQALGEIGPDAVEATSPLCTVSRELNLKVARAAVTALGRIGKDSPVVRQVLRLAANSPDQDLAARANSALAQLGSARSGK